MSATVPPAGHPSRRRTRRSYSKPDAALSRASFCYEPSVPYTCQDYREEQQLLALKKRLAEEDLSPREREEIERAIRELEQELGM